MKPLLVLALLALGACQFAEETDGVSPTATTDGLDAVSPEDSTLLALLGQYTTVRLEADLSGLSDSTRAMLPHLIAAARAMDDVYWMQAYGDRDSLLAGLSEPARRYVTINKGPWDRIDGNTPFLPGVSEKPLGANFYPADLTKDDLLAAADLYPENNLTSLYTLVRREGNQLVGIPYHEAFADAHGRAAAHLRAAADLAQDPGLATYLRLRADALLTDDYQASDLAWMDMRDNPLDIVIGPIETYEDQLMGFKASHEAYVLVKDQAWSERLRAYASLLPELQRGLPVDSVYKAETPGSDADLGAYDVVFVSGDANVGSKTIAINLPNDEAVQLAKGSRRLQLKNAMQAKFDRILVPIAETLLPEDQQALVTFDAFFGNTMFHEVAHGLGIKNTISGSGTVREALQDRASALEEGKADVLGLYMVQQLIDRGEWAEATLEEHYVTFMASVFRSIRFGASSAHGRANLVRFNYFQERGAIVSESTPDGPVWRVVPEQMGPAVEALARQILTLQGDGDYDAVDAFVRQYGRTSPELAASLDRVAEAGIPVDIVYEQGEAVLGLEPAAPLPPATR
ncbi:Zn-dependent hydrolase [Rubrivirga sp. SAORIC476]|uniref:dipeptidyl-peptidase 3 family protein n=1 Tax=Rubrivirga sp. SAORIC476 TaxID=1961794 RepID=UPI000BA9A5A3|nr:Zn-dependent hydrolase [Rubrivirga sp. SAORIC476]PAP81189.1 Zn-dependent hydrolase [Rubrivirga sp. SAORIC476]